MLSIGDAAPDFTLPTDNGGSVTLSELAGRSVVLYFYPKDDTSGCTKEACDFRDAAPDFNAVNAIVIGVSPDNPKKHDAFKAKHGLPFKLASDEEKTTLEAYGVWVEKSMYGRKYMGVERSTFLIGPDGTLQAIWRKVKVPGHVEAVRKVLAD